MADGVLRFTWPALPFTPVAWMEACISAGVSADPVVEVAARQAEAIIDGIPMCFVEDP